MSDNNFLLGGCKVIATGRDIICIDMDLYMRTGLEEKGHPYITGGKGLYLSKIYNDIVFYWLYKDL